MNWDTAGGDFTTDGQIVTLSLGGPRDTRSYIDVTPLVQYWVNHQSEHFGFVITTADDTVRGRIRSREYSGGAPSLEINSSAGAAIPEPGTLLLVCTGILGVFGYVRRQWTN